MGNVENINALDFNLICTDRINPTFGNCIYSTSCDFSSFDNASLTILHLNCRSLRKNVNSLVNLLSSLSFRLSVIAMSETWFSQVKKNIKICLIII